MSHFTVKFFASLREVTQTESLQVDVQDVATLDELIPFLISQYPQWAAPLEKPLMKAVNQNMVSGNVPLSAGDEVALFPPVTGG